MKQSLAISRRGLALLVSALALAAVPAARAQAQQLPECASVTVETCALAKSLGRGINLGNMLDAPREGDWGLRVEARFIELVAANFATVRLPVRWSNHAAPTEDAKLDETFARRVDGIIDTLLAKGVNVIVNVHHYNQLAGGAAQLPTEFAVDPAVVQPRFPNIWRQLAQRYRGRSPKLIFELLNEPSGKLDGEPWNLLAEKALAVVRESNPNRAVLIGPSYWNSVRDLPRFRMPNDRNLILSIHSYDPFGFTHQGASWIPVAIQQVGSTCCDAAQRQQITEVFDKARRWSLSKGYPAHLGEFGAYRAAAMPSREAYTRLVRDTAEARGMSWTYWEFASSFGVYDPKAGEWVEPLRRALLD
jgi:endoglucanase